MSACDCIKLMDEKLAEYNAQIVCTMFGDPKAVISTCKKHDQRSKKPPLVLATYCPFCGAKYGEPVEAIALGGQA